MAVGKALLTIRDARLYREEFKTFMEYCQKKWGVGKTYASYLIGGSRVAVNLATAGALYTPCEIQPIHEQQVRPLAQLEPNQQRDVWGDAGRSADGWQGLPFPNAGDFSEWGIFRRNRRNGVRPG
jgi:hypothetical protein